LPLTEGTAPAPGGARSNQTALVLGAGGIAGIAWMTGVLHGLAEEGLDLSGADRVIGTSAGAVVAAALTCGCSLAEAYAQVTAAEPNSDLLPKVDWRALAKHILPILTGSRDPIALACRIGQLALDANGSEKESLSKAVADCLPGTHWPQRDLTIVAVNAETGDAKLFDAACDVFINEAVCASCAVPAIWPPVAIKGGLYMDGGARSLDNADLAAGCRNAIILSSFGTLGLELSSRKLPVQLKLLEEAGTAAFVIAPDLAARAAFGLNPLSPAIQKPSAEAGLVQGRKLAQEIATFLGA